MPHKNCLELVVLAQDGHETSLRSLIRTTQLTLEFSVKKHLFGVPLAEQEDVLSETLFHIFARETGRLYGFDVKMGTSWNAFCRKILRDRAIDYRRYRGRRQDLEKPMAEVGPAPESHSSSPERQAVAKDLLRKIHICLKSKLNSLDVLIFEERFVHQKPTKDISTLTDRSLNTIQNRLVMIRKAAQECRSLHEN